MSEPLHKRPHGKKGQHFLQPVEMKVYHTDRNGDIYYAGNEKLGDPDDVCFMRAPMDAPAYLRWQRVISKDPNRESMGPKHVVDATIARTLEIDAFTFGVKVFVRIGTDGTLKVFAEDSDGMSLLQKWERE